METNCKYLFIYGTLMDADNEFGVYLRQNSTLIAEGYFNGLLYDMGEYPGALYQPEASTKVWGKIVSLNDPDKALAVIDEYEGYGPAEVQPNLFVRSIIAIHTKSATVYCWVYLYNLPVNMFWLIESGKYQ